MSHAAATRATESDLIGWRMRALGLWRQLPGTVDTGQVSGEDRIAAVAAAMLALQGQDWNAVRWALALRAPGTVERDVAAAFDSGRLVRSWPMRGTIHVLPAEDIGWMQAATGRRVLAGAPKRREYLGLDDATLTRMVDIAVSMLEGGRSASRDQLADAWTAAGIGGEQGVGSWRYHVVWWLCQNGIAVPGPVTVPGATPTPNQVISEPRLVLADEWIRRPRQLDGDEALQELATRFAAGRGPVHEKDFAWWTGLGIRDARRGLAGAQDEGRLTTVEVEERELWVQPELIDSNPTDAPADAATDELGGRHLLLPSFDEHLLGYTDRTAVLRSEHLERIVPGRNGMFKATAVRNDGKVVGVWARTPRKNHVRLEIEPLPGERMNVANFQAAAESWGAFRGSEIELTLAEPR